MTIPTYEIGKEEKNPIFLEKRVYQGSSGVVYPYPVIESIANEPTPHEWHVVFLENEYIKVMVMPELGGRIQIAYDKVKQRHFVYYNHVIKPALVGLTGPWISGGIEFNWPQHHRPSTYLPVDSTIKENEDGSVTVWCCETERMFQQRCQVGITLREGCAYIEIEGHLENRSDLPQTFLWWANPAVEVNDHYQSVFPPDVNAVFDHGKRAVSSFPIATGTYYKMDYSAGVDISNYKNIKVPTSYMAVNSKYDFEGGYENDTQGGMLHVASHHISPGKKQWTWGNGDFGRAWDRNLTDVPYRPYIELMAGVYTENQPDFTWLRPYEEKTFKQYFMPYREIGIVQQASKDVVMGISLGSSSEGEGSLVTFRLLGTSQQTVTISLYDDKRNSYYSEQVMLSPDEVFTKTVAVGKAMFAELNLDVTSVHSTRTLHWHAEPDEIRPIPDAAQAASLPQDIKTNDELYLTGMHLEQYRHATWNPVDYYEEALRRDPKDVRCLNALGRWYIRKGRFDCAEQLLRRAVKALTRFNPNPYDCEPFYNLALALKYKSLNPALSSREEGSNERGSTSGREISEAYELFWKATWDAAWADAAFFEAGKISLMQGRVDAVEELSRSRCLKAKSLLEVVLHYEQSEADFCDLNGYHNLALDYADAGLWNEADDVLRRVCDEHRATSNPMTWYYRAWFHFNQGDTEVAKAFFQQAEDTDPYCCFPNRLEDILVLETAKTVHRQSSKGKMSKAPYYLGCLYYDKRQYDLAIENWELSARLNSSFPTVWRNLALACFNKQNRKEESVEYMERAFHLDETDARVLMELDQLYKRLQRPHQQRLDFLQTYPDLIQQRDDLVLEEITLLNHVGRYEEAMQKLDAHQFHPWEGGEGKVPAQYQICRVEMAKYAIASGDAQELERAVSLLKACLEYPPHLGEGKLYGAQENDFYFLLGLAYELLGDQAAARRCYVQATIGSTEPAAAMYYNDAKPDKIFYAALAYRKLGEDDKANGLCYKLINYGKQHLFEHQTMDYFAVSLPDLLVWDGDLDTQNVIHCNLMLALGYFGLGDRERGFRFLEEVERLDINHPVPHALRTLIPNL